MKMGLHSDRASTGLTPFDIEMRRRLWWQICALDVRVAIDHSTEPSILEPTLDTRMPLNINDISLDPDIHQLPSNQQGKTEMLFTLVQFHTYNFARRVVFSDSFCSRNSYPTLTEAQRCQMIDEHRDGMEQQYLSHCNTGIPLDFITAGTARLMFAKIKLAVCKPRADRSRESPLRANYQKVCQEVLEQAYTLRQYTKGIRWFWLFRMDVEWDALAYLLLDICIMPSGETARAAWTLVEKIHGCWKDDPEVFRDKRWARIEDLRSEALVARERRRSLQISQIVIPEKQPEATPMMRSSSISRVLAHVATEDSTDDVPPLVADSQQYSPSEVDNQITQSSSPTNRQPLTILQAKTPLLLNETPSDASDLPGTNTACEWSAALFEQYWEVAGLRPENSTSWL